MGHDKLLNYFHTNFGLVQHHKWNLSEIENMIPWERYVYIDLLQAFLKAQEQEMKDAEVASRSQFTTLGRKRL